MESSPLSWDEFLASSKELLCISQRLNDGWNWSDTQDGWGYLHKTELKSSSGNEVFPGKRLAFRSGSSPNFRFVIRIGMDLHKFQLSVSINVFFSFYT